MNLFTNPICNFFLSAVFSESTVAALRFYHVTPSWLDTANFVEFVTNLWKILNVKTPCKGELLDRDQTSYSCNF